MRKEAVIQEADRTVCLSFLCILHRLMGNLEQKHCLPSFPHDTLGDNYHVGWPSLSLGDNDSAQPREVFTVDR